MIDQMTVFLENEKGRLGSLCRTLGDAGVNMHALMIADTTDFGVVRIICDAPTKATRLLRDLGYQASTTKVAAIEAPNRPGGMADVLTCLADADANIEYAYCFGSPSHDTAIVILKIHDGDNLVDALAAQGLKALQPEDIYSPDEL
ncbi:MAG: amino acid-binding protein [Actinobacteria bacterium]|nr:amino acid-binding protein [Actinomycetota bacterium]